jgi:hypothetical protein
VPKQAKSYIDHNEAWMVARIYSNLKTQLFALGDFYCHHERSAKNFLEKLHKEIEFDLVASNDLLVHLECMKIEKEMLSILTIDRNDRETCSRDDADGVLTLGRSSSVCADPTKVMGAMFH